MVWTSHAGPWIFFVGDLLRPRGYAIDLPERYIGLDEINAYRDAHPGENMTLARFVGAVPHVQENIVVPTLGVFGDDPDETTPRGLPSGAPENLTVPYTKEKHHLTFASGTCFFTVRVPNGSLNRFVNEVWREVGGRLEKKRTVDTDALIKAWNGSADIWHPGHPSGSPWLSHEIQAE